MHSRASTPVPVRGWPHDAAGRADERAYAALNASAGIRSSQCLPRTTFIRNSATSARDRGSPGAARCRCFDPVRDGDRRGNRDSRCRPRRWRRRRFEQCTAEVIEVRPIAARRQRSELHVHDRRQRPDKSRGSNQALSDAEGASADQGFSACRDSARPYGTTGAVLFGRPDLAREANRLRCPPRRHRKRKKSRQLFRPPSRQPGSGPAQSMRGAIGTIRRRTRAGRAWASAPMRKIDIGAAPLGAGCTGERIALETAKRSAARGGDVLNTPRVKTATDDGVSTTAF